MWITSQEGGGLIHDNTPAFSAPGSEPATPMPDAAHQANPAVDLGPDLPAGTPPRKTGGSYSPSALSWKKVTDG